MNTPPLLIAAALLFWGWQTGILIPAILAAIFTEGSRLVSYRLSLSLKDFRKIWNLVIVIFLVATVFIYSLNDAVGAIYVVIKWSPLIFLPIFIAQTYSLTDKLDLDLFSLFYKVPDHKSKQPSAFAINLAYPYFMLCVGAASAANIRTIWFYTFLSLLTAWALWSIRPKRYSMALWTFVLGLAITFGYAGSVGLEELQKVGGQKFQDWWAERSRPDQDPFKNSTAIGEIGKLKMSNRVLFRVKDSKGYKGSIYLQLASYNVYRKTSWYASKSPFSSVQSATNGTTWKFYDAEKEDKTITVYSYLKDGKGLLTIPHNLFQIERLPVLQMSKNRMGAVKVEEGPGFVSYELKLGKVSSVYGPPDGDDLKIPKEIEPELAKITEELNLESKPPNEILTTVSRYFSANFEYSLDLQTGKFDIPINDFLVRTRSGHCEYFATATTLLLRKAGIPARYTKGFMVTDYSRLENKFVVRGRDAHAWVTVYIDGKWRNFDTTPGSWVVIDKENASLLEPLYDFYSYLVFLFSEWRWSEKESVYQIYLLLLLAPLIFFIFWQVYSRAKVSRKVDAGGRTVTNGGYRKTESDYYLIENRLRDLGKSREKWETPLSWLKRIENEKDDYISLPQLHNIVSLHYRYRFDPSGLPTEEAATLKEQVKTWLEEHDLKV